MVIIII